MQTTQDLFKELGLEDLPVERQAAILSLMTEVLLKKLTLEIGQKLSEDEFVEFGKLRETNDPEKIHLFLQAKIPGYDELVAKTAAEFKENIKADISSLQ